jgi:hypothetical protein
MSVLTARGGVPYVVRDTVTTAGRKYRLPFYINYLKVRTDGGNRVKIFFTEEDYTADENFVAVPVAGPSYPNGEWDGPVETCAGDHSDIWLRGDGGDAPFELVAFQRRG